MSAAGSSCCNQSSIILLSLILCAPAYAQTPNGTITGVVRNSDGTPAAGVPMTAQSDGPILSADGRSTVVTVFVTPLRTDLAGRFRISNLIPGRYRVAAGLLEYGPTYYPGTTNVSEATVLTLGAGATVENVDLTLTRPSSFRVSGKVRRPAGTRPDAPMVTKIGMHDANTFTMLSHGGRAPFLYETTVASDGSFEFAGIPQGKYQLSTEPVLTSWTPLPLEVSVGDVEKLDVLVPLESQVSVRATVDQSIPLPPRFTVSFGDLEAQRSGVLPFPRGAFPSQMLLSTLQAGEYRIAVNGLSSPYYVKSITSGMKDLLKEPLLVDGIDRVEVDVTFALPAGNTANVRGRVILPPGFSLPASQRVTLYVRGTTTNLGAPLNPDGTFEFVNVPRGNYEVTLLAVSSLLYRNTPVTVLDKDVTDADILVPRQITLRGKVVVEGGGPLVRPRLETNRPNLNTNPTVRDDGTFEIMLPEGEYTFGVQDLPRDYFAKSVTFGALDLLSQPLQLGNDSDAEVLVTLAPRVPGLSAP